MSDIPDPYTPTDEEVRIKYALASAGPQAKAEFDRWLAARDARVRAEQREADAKIADPAYWEAVNAIPDIGEPLSWREHGYAVAAAIREGKP